MFFVISGFIMTFVSQGMKGGRVQSAVAFFVRRIFRVAPLYWRFTFVAYVLAFMSISCPPHLSTCPFYLGDQYNFSKTSFDWLFQSLTFTHWSRGPIYSIGWTLIYEFWFYALVSFCLLLGTRMSHFFTALLALVLLARFPFFDGIQLYGAFDIMLHPFMIEFIFGVYLYMLFDAEKLKPKWIVPFVTASAILAGLYQIESVNHILGGFSRPLLAGGTAFFVVGIALILENTRFQAGALLTRLGDSSYSLYLTHWLVITNLPSLMDIYGFGHVSFLTFIILNVGASLALSEVVYYLVEKPLRDSSKVQIEKLLTGLGIGQSSRSGSWFSSVSSAIRGHRLK